jgi:hypothetical protein
LIPRTAPSGEHASDPVVALRILWASLVASFRLCLGLTLRLPAAAIDVILAGHRGEHIEQHAVDGFEHAPGELIAGIGGHHPRRRQIQRHHPHAARRHFRFQAFPVLRCQARETVDLLDQENIARMRIREQPEQLGPGELGTNFVLDIPGGDGEPALGREGPESWSRARWAS